MNQNNYSSAGTRKKLDAIADRRPLIRNRIIVILLQVLLIAVIAGCAAGGTFTYRLVKSVIAEAPDIATINVRPTGYASTIYDRNGVAITTLVQAGSNRKEVTYAELPKDMINAVIAIEDERFWSHDGVDIKGILRAGFVGLSSGHFSEGASTLTQQLLKNNVFDGGAEKDLVSRVKRKIKEQYLALQLENRMSKEDILTNYLNTINLGSNTLGVGAAAKRYFNKEISDLTLSECAVIAAITQNPSKYNPISHPDNNRTRQLLVLGNMLKQGKISKADYEEAMDDDVYSRIQNVNLTYADSRKAYSYFVDAVVEEVISDFLEMGMTQTQAYNYLYSGGLSIYSTQDSTIQKVMDTEVNNPDNYPVTRYSFTYSLKITSADGTTKTFTENDIRSYKKQVLGASAFAFVFDEQSEIEDLCHEFEEYITEDGDQIEDSHIEYILEPQTSMVILDNTTSQVLAISGGRGPKKTSLSLNRAIDSMRQPGSCFKVLADFAPAIDTCGATLATTYYDSPVSASGKSFQNWWGSDYVGFANIRQGIVYSMNLISVKCMIDTVTPELGYEYLQNFGITTLVDNLQTENGLVTDKVPALCLGGITYGVTNLEMTAAYAAIANRGVYNSPSFYTAVYDSSDNLICQPEITTKTVLKDSTAVLLTRAMEDSFRDFTPWPEHGITALGLTHEVEGMSAAAKSGSTTNNNDVWFEGYTPYYTCGIWGGYDDSISFGGGQVFHKNIWSKVMSQIHKNLPDIGFATTNDIVTAKICSKSGLLAVEGVCDNLSCNSIIYDEYFTRATVPTAYCDRHVKLTFCEDSQKLATPFCPESHTYERVYLTGIPEDAADITTDDSLQALPENLKADDVCQLHRDPAEETEEETEEESVIEIEEISGAAAESKSSAAPSGASESRPGENSSLSVESGNALTIRPGN